MKHMPGLIKREVIDEIRARVRIEDVVSSYVTLKPAGTDSLSGLCPFHDEKTPSFHVRPSIGRWHCFGCGEGGDIFSFVENVEHITFVEAIELLAQRAGIELLYDDGPRKESRGPTRARLIDAHRVAIEFYHGELESSEGRKAAELLYVRGFDEEVLRDFEIGYAPRSWDGLFTYLRKRGFSENEIAIAGLGTAGRRGLYDRFRGRLMWPIFSITGEPIGFGARKISDEEDGPKYLNTPETPIYKKSQVLYGLNRAKKAISGERRIVVVEGYTDVMAAQLAGVECAVATCGTAFGTEHVKIVRRLLGDGANPAAGVMLASGHSYGGEVIFTFDGDAAGQKAALKAFGEDQAFAAQTFVAVAPGGMDPCDMRMHYGDEGVRKIVEGRRPLFEFVIRSVLRDLPLETAEGRARGLRAAAPIVASIRDRVLRGEYTRQLSGWLGMDEQTVRAAVRAGARRGGSRGGGGHVVRGGSIPGAGSHNVGLMSGTRVNGEESSFTPSGGEGARASSFEPSARAYTDSGVGERPAQAEYPQLVPLSLRADPALRIEREALEVMLQLPWYAERAMLDQVPSQTFVDSVHRRLHEAIVSAGGSATYMAKVTELVASGMEEEQAKRKAIAAYFEGILAVDSQLEKVVGELSVLPLPESRPDRLQHYVWSIALSLIRQGITRQIGQVRSQLQRTSPDDPAYHEVFARLMELEEQRRACEEQME